MGKKATATADPPDNDDVNPTDNTDGRTVNDYLDVRLGIDEGPAKNVATVGDLLKSYQEIVKEHGKVKRDLKAALTKAGEDPSDGAPDKGEPTTALWDRAIEDFSKHGHITSETMAALEKATRIPGVVFGMVATAMEKAQGQFAEKTKAALGVDVDEFNTLLDQAGYSQTQVEFIQDQVLAGRYGFLSDVADDLKSRGLVDESKIAAGKGDDGESKETTNDDGGPGQPGKPPQQRRQVDMGQPPTPPKPDSGWETEASYTSDFNEAKMAERQGDASKMEALQSRMTKLEGAGQKFYPGSPDGMTIQ